MFDKNGKFSTYDCIITVFISEKVALFLLQEFLTDVRDASLP